MYSCLCREGLGFLDGGAGHRPLFLSYPRPCHSSPGASFILSGVLPAGAPGGWVLAWPHTGHWHLGSVRGGVEPAPYPCVDPVSVEGEARLGERRG